MRVYCKDCGLNASLEEYRVRLNNKVIKKRDNLIDEEVIELSQLLDNLVYKCISCVNKSIYTASVGLKDIFGIHSSFYYYGHKHLFTNMFFYITEGIKNNELIYISMQHDLYHELIEFLRSKDVCIEHIKFRPVKDLILCHKKEGFVGLRDKIDSICVEDAVKEYNGVRWIGQPTYAIQTTSQEDFLDWEIDLSKALENRNVSLICVYDAYDYIVEGKYINEEVIKKSKDTHSYILKDLVLERYKNEENLENKLKI
ncbi:MEDS domain-containing protein [Anaerovorax sp. IOR16]|uniref:MEDS domain-containing protein n=1 Tax=Anaerovorax sp. IOR16 TaxID=2773458 RepID=UPI0019D04235|nr:MEDS domain-containing protein [Anaerovorax sp. IOR16]